MRLRILVAFGLLAALAACSGSDGDGDPTALMAKAKTTLDGTAGLHFALSSSGVPDGGTVLTGGNGDVVRPDGFTGTLKIRLGGLSASVDVISAAGVVYVKPPLVPGFSKADPSKYGFSDPGKLLDPDSGLTTLLSQATDVKSAGSDRLGGEALDEVDASIPGAAVDEVLASADPTQPVQARLGIAESGQLRRAVLTGPFLDAAVQTTYTIVLDRYGQTVTIRAPD